MIVDFRRGGLKVSIVLGLFFGLALWSVQYMTSLIKSESLSTLQSSLRSGTGADEVNEQIENEFLKKLVNPAMYSDVQTDYGKFMLVNGIYRKGHRPLSVERIVNELGGFIEAFRRSPSTDNQWGTSIFHQFALWCIIRKIQPKYVIESGIFKGLGTYMLRQSAPNAKIITLDPGQPDSSLVYRDRHNDSLYLTSNKFKDFNSLSKDEWAKLVDPERTVVFFDDHQFEVRRLREAKDRGFHHVIFDDNYHFPEDAISMKQLINILHNNGMTWDMFKYKNRDDASPVTEQEKKDAADMLDQMKVYYEFPMMWRGKYKTNPDNNNVLFDVKDGNKILGWFGFQNPNRIEEHLYFNICYIYI